MKVTLLYFDGCPNGETTEDAERVGFRGSPTVLVDGRDPFAQGDEPIGLSCRIYQTLEGPAGTPTLEQLRAAVA